MLKLDIKISDELYDDIKEEFIPPVIKTIELEHSLISLSKWESKFEKPFLGLKEKTTEDILGYIYCMIVTPDYPHDIVSKFSQENLEVVQEYIDAKMTATWFPEEKNQRPNREVITSEVIYYWLTTYQIPWEAQYWHLNRLFTLIKVFNAKNSKPTKMSRAEMLAQRKALNDQRKQQYKTNG